MPSYRAADVGWNVGNLMPTLPGQQHRIWRGEKPPLVVGFDTETTGLSNDDQLVTFATSVYRDQKPAESTHYTIRPTVPINRDASNMNGWFNSDIDRSYRGEPLRKIFSERQSLRIDDKKTLVNYGEEDFSLPNAIDSRVAINRAVEQIKKYHEEGAVFVGANPSFDIKKIKDSWEKLNGMPFELSGLEIGKLRLVDVVAHDRAIDLGYERGHPLYRSRSLTNLCEHYGVDPGGHRAKSDSDAAVGVFFKQMDLNNSKLRTSSTKFPGKRKFSFKTTMPSGVELNKLVPHDSMSAECVGCHYLNELESLHTEAGDKKMIKIIGLYRQLHNPEGV